MRALEFSKIQNETKGLEAGSLLGPLNLNEVLKKCLLMSIFRSEKTGHKLLKGLIFFEKR